jgi:hypothetical protein
MWRQKIKCHRGWGLSKEQIAVAAVLAQAISNYSEDSFCAGWMHDIEHELWERIVARKPDAYERSVKKLYAAAKKERRDWGKPSAEFLAGLKLLGKHFQVWIYYKKGETAIHLKDWVLLHEQWHENRKQQRSSLEEVWKRIHEPFPFLKSKKPVRMPPMPKLH